MIDLFTPLIQHPALYLANAVVLLLVGVGNVYLVINKRHSALRDEADKEQLEYITALKGRMDVIERSYVDMQGQLTAANIKLDQMLAENRRLEAILAMRDPESIELRKLQHLAFQQVNALYEALIVKKGRRTTVGS